MEQANKIDIMQMGQEKAREALRAAMTGTQEQMDNQANFMYAMAMELIINIAFNYLIGSGQVIDRTALMEKCNQISGDIYEGVVNMELGLQLGKVYRKEPSND